MIWILLACSVMCILLLLFILYLLHEEIFLTLFNFECEELQHDAICSNCHQEFVWINKDILYNLRPKKGYMVFCPHCSMLVNVNK